MVQGLGISAPTITALIALPQGIGGAILAMSPCSIDWYLALIDDNAPIPLLISLFPSHIMFVIGGITRDNHWAI